MTAHEPAPGEKTPEGGSEMDPLPGVGSERDPQ